MPAAVKDSPNKIFVSNVPKNWNDVKFKATFEVFGQIAEVNLMKNRETGASRGFGFITFVTEDDASDAIQGMNGKDVDGSTLKVDYALKSLHASGGGGGGDRGRGRGGSPRGGMRGMPMRGRGGPLLRGAPRGGFVPRGGPPSRGGMMRGRGRGMGQEGEGSYRGRGGPPSRGMPRGGGMEGSMRGSPRGGPRGGPRGSPRGSGRGAPGAMGRGRGAGRPPVDDYERDSGYGAPRGRSLLGKEPLLQEPGGADFHSAREPRGRPEQEPDSYRSRYPEGGLLPRRQAPLDAPLLRREEPLIRDREPLSSRPSERYPAERSRPSYPAEREPAYGSRAAAGFGEESYGKQSLELGSGRSALASGRGAAREGYGAGGRSALSSYDYAEPRPSARSELASDPYRREQFAPSELSSARSARDSFGVERDYAPPTRSVDPYGAPSASSAAPSARGYGAGGREQALARDPAALPPRETPRPGGRESLLAPRDYGAPARDFAETRRDDPPRDYAGRAPRAAYPEERAPASYGSRSYDEYEKAAGRGYGTGADAYGSARDPVGSAPSSRAAYSSRDPYPAGRGERAEKPGGYGDMYRSGPSYGGRSAPSDRNGSGASSRPYSRF